MKNLTITGQKKGRPTSAGKSAPTYTYVYRICQVHKNDCPQVRLPPILLR
jgi:hypothetical protein